MELIALCGHIHSLSTYSICSSMHPLSGKNGIFNDLFQYLGPCILRCICVACCSSVVTCRLVALVDVESINLACSWLTKSKIKSPLVQAYFKHYLIINNTILVSLL